MHTTHSRGGSIAGSHGVRGASCHQFGDEGGSRREIVCQPSPVLKKVVNVATEAYTVSVVTVAKRFLEGAKQAAPAGDGSDHGAELPKDLVPRLRCHPALVRSNGSQDGVEAGNAVGRQFDGAGVGVNVPAKDGLSGGPCGVAFEHLFEGCGLLAVWVIIRG